VTAYASTHTLPYSGESYSPGGRTEYKAWKGCLDDLVARGLAAPVVCVIDGHAGLRKAVGLVWPEALVQRCAVHKLRNLERKAPKHALAEIRADFHRIVYAENLATARGAFTAFERKWRTAPLAWSEASRRGAKNCSRVSSFPRANGRRSEQRT
jgi:putative transposase